MFTRLGDGARDSAESTAFLWRASIIHLQDSFRMQKSQRTRRRLALAFFRNDSIRFTLPKRGVAEVAAQWSCAFINEKSARSCKTQLDSWTLMWRSGEYH